jgi:proline iminopeptidase
MSGSRLIPVETAQGRFHVWTRRTGRNPRIRVLLLHGGPGVTHEYFEVCDRHLPEADVEYYYYDQLGSYYSDQPDDPGLWDLPRFVDEVEQVRRALGLGRENFFLLGHSWGGILAIEYALAHPTALKGLIIANMMSSIPAYNDYAREVLMPRIDPAVLAEIQALEAAGRHEDPRYMELLIPHHYQHHVLRMPVEQWPDPVKRAFSHLNAEVYVPMQGPSELGASGRLVDWDRSPDLGRLAMPVLTIGARHDTMDPAHMAWMARQIPQGRHHLCPVGSHLAMYDDENAWFDGLLGFLRAVDGLS